eukprot:jgi/Phyca11/510553/fgenesh2_kg.PHYCAscaffold_62_\
MTTEASPAATTVCFTQTPDSALWPRGLDLPLTFQMPSGGLQRANSSRATDPKTIQGIPRLRALGCCPPGGGFRAFVSVAARSAQMPKFELRWEPAAPICRVFSAY